MISEEAVQRATGHPWDFWRREMDRYGLEIDHTTRARRLAAAHPDLAGWWVQSLTVEFERERGLREVGQTPTGYQVSCSKTLPMDPVQVWQRLLEALEGDWREGATWSRAGAEVEVRRVDPGHMLRWVQRDSSGKSTVEATLQERGERCTLTFRHHGLAHAQARQQARVRWKAVLERLEPDRLA